ISQYRIRQVDLDGKSKFSLIRAVRGEGQSVKTIVYPNPSRDGKITVVFEEKMVSRDISLSDISGRVIRQWKGVTNNIIQIDNLHPGVFTLRILVPATGEQGVEKVVINNR
ncbi:MAG TPA: T9SS type A sorting domain-containing protein, partial [Chitinophagaceae bacterium]|nr:T9SS type A sorting domain-containing protein [Chitinophagaceae bacterium]